MVYQKGTVYLQGTREQKWYGKFRIYQKGRDGKEAERTRKIVLGSKAQLRKWEAVKKLQEIILRENGSGGYATFAKTHDDVTFDLFVQERYLPMRQGGWRPATKTKTEFEIRKYLVEGFTDVPLSRIGAFEIQMVLNHLAASFSESIVKHAYGKRKVNHADSAKTQVHCG